MDGDVIWNENLSPPGGLFRFNGDDDIIFESQTIIGLVEKVADYRKRKGVDVGTPGSEVVHQLCSRHPERCMKVKSVSESFKKQSRNSAFLASVSAWVREKAMRIRRGHQQLVGGWMQRKRARVCRECPFRRDLPKSCPSCQQNVGKLIAMLTRGRMGNTNRLGGCTKYQTDLRLDTFLKQGIQSHTPKGCWKSDPNLCNPA